jgi:hypothetical protein
MSNSEPSAASDAPGHIKFDALLPFLNGPHLTVSAAWIAMVHICCSMPPWMNASGNSG